MRHAKTIGALAVLALGAGLLFARPLTVEERLRDMTPEPERRLAAREVQIDPAELLELMNDNTMRLRILDVRSEADFNLFHIVDAVRVRASQLGDPAWVRGSLPKETALVLVSNGERAAAEGWKLLAAQEVPNIYLLAGGINLWLDRYGGDHDSGGVVDAVRVSGDPADETLHHRFTAALGSQHPASDPDPHRAGQRAYEKKVKPIGHAKRKSGGCG